MKLPAALEEKAKTGELAHAYLLSGAPDGVLEEAARAVAAAYLCKEPQPPCGQCKACRKVEKDIHPDLIWVERPADKSQISVDQIRAVRAEAYVRPNEAPRKVYILRRAYQMSPEAQNAFLKVLEEGPVYAAFLLLSPNDAALLPTIRSRCETVRVTAAGAQAQEQADPGLERKAGELAVLLLEGDYWRIIGWCVPYEKAKREEVIPLWEATRQALLTYRDPKTTAKAAALCGCLAEMINAAANQNGNIGILWGRLWAKA